MRSFKIGFRTRTAAIACSVLFICVLSPAGYSQPATNSLPRVGTIKDYPATGLMVGCGNLYFYKAADANSTTANYVFLSRGDGGNAWMNLNARDVRLQKIRARGDRKFQRYSYRYRDVRITVEFAENNSSPGTGETDHTHRMKITLRRGGKLRIVRAVGGSDC